MPYSPNYLIRQMAQGKMPTGTPEEDLAQAIARLSSMEIDTAFQVGASPLTRIRGKGPFHALLDRAFGPDGLREDPRRVLECVRALSRHGVRLDEVDPQTRETAAARLGHLANDQVGPELIRILSRRMVWDAPAGPHASKTVRETWEERASPLAAENIPKPARPRMR